MYPLPTAAVAAVLLTAGCGGADGPQRQLSAEDTASVVQLVDIGTGRSAVDPDRPLTVSAVHGARITDVTVVAADGRRVAGALAADDRSWRTTGPLAAGQQYTVRVSAENADGARGTTLRGFTTRSADTLLTAALTPGDGQVYGVGEPITATLSLPVHDPAARQAVERAFRVTSDPAVDGAWYWVDDRTLHFRPEHYWPAHATVSVSFDLAGRRVEQGVYGGASSRSTFRTGESFIAVTDVASDEMAVYRDGNLVRSIPVTTGKEGFRTRGGIKVVLEKSPEVYMNSATVDIPAGSANSYALNVFWAARVTWSGEYVHAAPWSVGSQGVQNVSHGCTGMSTANAEWFYQNVRPGDIVQVVHGLGRPMEPFGNGFGDWNVPWSQWLAGSALHQAVSTAGQVSAGPAAQAGPQVGVLRPEA
jgi:lipoprotein-anchoring transpeptidase ErfK/SrfK